MVVEILVVFFLIAGALFMLLASIGLIRFPDTYMRLHASTKSTSLGMLLILFGTGLFFGEMAVWIKEMLTIIFIFLTVPIASHAIARVAHHMNIPMWKNTMQDDLQRDNLEQEERI